MIDWLALLFETVEDETPFAEVDMDFPSAYAGTGQRAEADYGVGDRKFEPMGMMEAGVRGGKSNRGDPEDHVGDGYDYGVLGEIYSVVKPEFFGVAQEKIARNLVLTERMRTAELSTNQPLFLGNRMRTLERASGYMQRNPRQDTSLPNGEGAEMPQRYPTGIGSFDMGDMAEQEFAVRAVDQMMEREARRYDGSLSL